MSSQRQFILFVFVCYLGFILSKALNETGSLQANGGMTGFDYLEANSSSTTGNADARTLNASEYAMPEVLRQFLGGVRNVSVENASMILRDYLKKLEYPGIDSISDEDLIALVDRFRRQQNETDIDNIDAFSNLTNESLALTETVVSEPPSGANLTTSVHSTADSTVPIETTAYTTEGQATSTTGAVEQDSEHVDTNTVEPLTTTTTDNSNSSIDSIIAADHNISRCDKANNVLQSLVGRWSQMSCRSNRGEVHVDMSGIHGDQTTSTFPDGQTAADADYYLPFYKPEVATWQLLNDLRRNPTLWSIFESDPGVLFVAAHWVRRTYFASVPEPMVDPLVVNKMILERNLEQPTSNSGSVDVKTMLAEIERNPAIRDVFLNAPDTLTYVLSSISVKYPDLNISTEALNCTSRNHASKSGKQMYDPLPWYMKVRALLRKEFKDQSQVWSAYYDRTLQCITKCAVTYEFDQSASVSAKEPFNSELSNSLRPDFDEEQLNFIGVVMDNPEILNIVISEWQFVSTVIEEAIKAEILNSIRGTTGLQSAMLNYFSRYPYTLEKLMQNPMLVAYALQNSADGSLFYPSGREAVKGAQLWQQPAATSAGLNICNSPFQTGCVPLQPAPQQSLQASAYGGLSIPVRFYQLGQARGAREGEDGRVQLIKHNE